MRQNQRTNKTSEHYKCERTEQQQQKNKQATKTVLHTQYKFCSVKVLYQRTSVHFIRSFRVESE